jgi:hypothetical protein
VAAVNRDELLETLRTLHEELSKAEQVDPSTVALLEAVTEDIQRLVGPRTETRADDAEPVTNRLRELLYKFEGNHPQLAGLIQRISDGLANLGI